MSGGFKALSLAAVSSLPAGGDPRLQGCVSYDDVLSADSPYSLDSACGSPLGDADAELPDVLSQSFPANCNPERRPCLVAPSLSLDSVSPGGEGSPTASRPEWLLEALEQHFWFNHHSRPVLHEVVRLLSPRTYPAGSTIPAGLFIVLEHGEVQQEHAPPLNTRGAWTQQFGLLERCSRGLSVAADSRVYQVPLRVLRSVITDFTASAREDLCRRLRTLQPFAECPAETLLELADACRERYYEESQVVRLTGGSGAANISVVLCGSVRSEEHGEYTTGCVFQPVASSQSVTMAAGTRVADFPVGYHTFFI